jgi:ribose-phosphate pyrophosphokinase
MLKKFCVLNNARTIYKFEEDNDLNVPTKFIKFANGEIKTEIMQSIRGENIYIVQDVANFENQLSCNDAIFQLLTTIDAVRHSSGKNITLILPTFPYSRQHRKTGREGLTASLLCQIFESLDVVRIITLDIHSKEIENSLHKAVLENLFPSESFALTLKSLLTSEDDLVVVSPDTGAVARNKFYATVFKCPLAFLYKERDYSKISTSAADSNIIDIKLLGNVKDKTCFIVDDMIGTGSTIIEAVKFLKYNGAKKIIIAVSLPFFNSNAIDIFEAIYKDGFFDKVIGTNAVFNSRLNKRGWFIRVDISELFAKVIFNLENNLSISDLVDNKSAIQSLL